MIDYAHHCIYCSGLIKLWPSGSGFANTLSQITEKKSRIATDSNADLNPYISQWSKVSDPYCQDWRPQGHEPGVPGRAAGGDRCAGRPRLPRARLSGTQARGHFTIFYTGQVHLRNATRLSYQFLLYWWIHRHLNSSVADPWHFGVDPDPRIHTPD